MRTLNKSIFELVAILNFGIVVKNKITGKRIFIKNNRTDYIEL